MQQIFGYARVSSLDQNLATQLEELTRAGCTRIFQEKVTGVRESSPEFDEMCRLLRQGDTVMVNRLSRLGRKMAHVVPLIVDWNQRGIEFISLHDGFDSQTPVGRLFLKMLAAFNEYDREVNLEKSLAGITLAKAAGKHLGRRPGRNKEKLAKVKRALEKGLSLPEIVDLTGISRASVKRYRRELTAHLDTETATE